MRVEYVIVGIILMIIIILVAVALLSGSVPAVKNALDDVACMLGFVKC